MQMDVEDLLLGRCRVLIEQKQGWGSSDLWTNHDFEVLSEKIEKTTKVNLSPATLKRIWGKIKYTSRPTITTLDTLVQFVEYENWRVFKIKNTETDLNGSSKNNGHIHQEIGATTGRPKKPRGKLRFFSAVIAACLGIFLLVLFLNRDDTNDTDEGNEALFYFSSKKLVSEGVPNSVIFEYDATRAAKNDTIYVQQSWDIRLREQVSKDNHNHTSIYYYPGFFQAKLVVNNRIVREHNLYITTNGWLPVIEQDNVPVYFKAGDAIGNGVMTLSTDNIVNYGIALQPDPPWIAFHNSRTFDGLTSDNFIFETEVKNDYKTGGGICQLTEIHLRMEGGVFIVPLSIKGCVSNVGIYDIEGKKGDPSPLGCDFSDWVNVRLEVKDKKGELFINNKKAYDLNYAIPTVKIVGLLYRFQGTGSVNFAKLSNVQGQVIYEDQF